MTPDVHHRDPHTKIGGEVRSGRPEVDHVGDCVHAQTIACRNSDCNIELHNAGSSGGRQAITMCNMHTTMNQRLKLARQQSGHSSAKAFAEKHGIPQPTYAMHESGARKLTPEVARKYGDYLGVSDAWLLTGKGDGPGGEIATQASKVTDIDELDVRAEAGPGGMDTRMYEAPETVVDRWQLPSEMLRAHTTAGHDHLKVIRVYGDSMSPEFMPGERVLVDTSDQVPSPSGIFVLYDGLGIVLKRVEYVPYSDPPVVQLKSSNPAYDTYTRDLSEVTINGRVIAKWEWT